jgi:hypothetical protein
MRDHDLLSRPEASLRQTRLTPYSHSIVPGGVVDHAVDALDLVDDGVAVAPNPLDV